MREIARSIVIGLVGLAALLLGRVALTAFVAAAGVFAGGELFRMVRAHGIRPSPLIGLAGITALFAIGHVRGDRAPNAFPAAIAAVVVLSFVALIARSGREAATRAVAFTIMPVLFVGLLGAYVPAMRASTNGFRLVLGFGALVAGAAAGTAILHGRRRGAHATDESRTQWQPFAGAVGGSLIASVIVGVTLEPPFTMMRAMILGIVVGLAVPAARLAIGFVEADLARAEPGVRRLRPVVLPRIDGLLFAAPVFFYAYRVLAR